MNTELPFTLSLVILLLPLLGFLLQLLLGRMRVPLDYAADPHESPAHQPPDGGIAGARTSDHSQPATDVPHAGAHHPPAPSRAPWSDRDQRRAYRLSWISTGLAGVALLLAILVALPVFSGGAGHDGAGHGAAVPDYRLGDAPSVHASARWLDLGDRATSPLGVDTTVSLGLHVDGIAAVMLVVVTLISFLVHLFSSEYMRRPSMHGGRLNRYYAFLGLFTFSMLGIVLADNLLMIYIFWELVGFSSYLLIGYWYERPAPQYASMKAFITNRIGDIGMFAGIMILFTRFGTFRLPEIFAGIAAMPAAEGTGLWLTIAGVLLFCGAIGKSAQFPLNVWLPDAMEGPTPVSALIHAATMVAAGVYLTVRIYPLLTGDAMLTIAAVGALTSLLGASLAMAQWDLKKVLAFSTVSQLGYMVMAVGVGAWGAALMHLVTHAMFKACLFLAAGSVIHRMHDALHDMGDHRTDPQDMRNMGGLRRKMPITFVACLVATLSISGIPLFSGYLSKDAILVSAWTFAVVSPGVVATLVATIGYLVAGMTAFYMLRMLLLTFGGRPRVEAIFERLRESPRVMTAPLVILAVLSLWFPYSVNPLHPVHGWLYRAMHAAPASVTPPSLSPHALTKFPGTAAPGYPRGYSTFERTFLDTRESLWHLTSAPALLTLGVAALGLLIAWRRFGAAEARVPESSAVATGPIGRLLANRFYQDDLYERYFPVGAARGATKLLAWFDQNIVDGVVNAVGAAGIGMARVVGAFDTYVVDGIVNFLAGTTQFLGMTMRQLQTGRIQTYIVYIVLGVVILFFAFR